MHLLPCSPRVLTSAIHAAVLAAVSAPAMAQQVVADGTHREVPAASYDDSAPVRPFSGVFHALNGGAITAADPVTVTASRSMFNGAWALGAGSRISLDGGVVEVGGSTSAALLSTEGGAVHANGMILRKTGSGQGIRADGEGSVVGLSDSEIRTSGDSVDGMYARNGALLDITDSRIHTDGRTAYGINANMGDPRLRLRDVAVLTEGDHSAAMWSISGADINAGRVQFTTQGNNSAAVDVRGGKTTITSGHFDTHGESAHGVVAQREAGAAAQLTMTDVTIDTRGASASGIVARSGARAEINESDVRTGGKGAHGLLVSGPHTHVTLSETHVRAEGEGAQALRFDGGKFDMHGGSLVGAQGAAIGVSGGGELDIRGARLQGGSGELLALGASAAGATVLRLREGTQAFGDIVHPSDADGRARPPLSVSLDGGSAWQGATSIVDQLDVGAGSRWTVGADSTVGNLVLDGGTVALGQVDGAFTGLTVDGDFSSTNGVLVLDARLEGDDAAASHLHVKGNTSGNTSLAVNNVGGMAPTRGDGIEVVSVDGRSDGEFALAGRAARGNIEYFLHRGTLNTTQTGDWFLRSALPPGPDPGVEPGMDPEPTADPEPILRPEPGAYWANQNSVMVMFQHRLQDRLGVRLPHPGEQHRGAWGHVRQQQQDYLLQGNQLEIDANSTVTQVGSDLFGNETARAGLMVGHGTSRNRSRSVLSGYQAEGRVEGASVGLYASWFDPSEDQSGFQLDSWVQWAEYRQRVQGTALAPERYRSRTASASVELGYAWPLNFGEFTTVYVEPQMQINYTDYKAAAHVEQNGTVVTSQGAGGLSTRTGIRIYGRNGSHGPHDQVNNWVQPYVTLNWIRNSHATDSLRFDGQPWAGGTETSKTEAKVGVQLQLSPRTSGWGEFGVESGSNRHRGVGAQMGLRYNW